MPAVFVLNKPVSYVAASLLSTAVVLQWQAMKVAVARMKAGVEYPRMYADSEAEKDLLAARIFNCTQRAHQNTIENFPIILATTLITALKYPTTAAAACGTVSILRVIYTISYGGSGDPKKRIASVRLIFIIQLVMICASTKAVFDLFLESV